ncbi:Y-family DNA polymerase [Aliivibrio sp. S10_S31]|uniref:Y-family DNA polymerase n=1 Tax=Aliivibrio sp. S10_S31 TaxID=2720224 RepID=UPI0016818D8B|nr:Y-family DNA polymerase [Aliivibrio sp. S10_S31]MBD1570301.1 Y-family DNA polymerase [Aliivibrio sp. S10_S31]
MFALVDANSFYCSAEQVFRPEWRNRPIIVLSNNDGMIVAANRQATEAGIPKFKPYFQIKKQCEEKGVIALSSNYELYSDLSSKMMEVIGRFAPEQHIYSIDESFLSFKRSFPAIPCLRSHANQLRKAVWKECRLPVCVGMGTTLTLAKVANHAAKKFAGYHGVCVLDNEQERLNALHLLSVEEVWGIGRKLSERMHQMGIHTALQLTNMPIGLVRKNFNVEVERIVLELNGTPCKSWDVARADKKQIFSTRSMGNRITDLDALQQALAKHAAIASQKARKQGSLCKTLLCFASNSPHDDKPVNGRATHHFAYPTADVNHITSVVTRIAKELFHPDVRYYKVGVGLLDLLDGRHEQFDLLNPAPNNNQLMTIFDKINHKYGTDTLFLGAQGINTQWGMKREMLTPQYTTKWKDIPKIRC